jgi:hypothetical protein
MRLITYGLSREIHHGKLCLGLASWEGHARDQAEQEEQNDVK